MQRKENEMKVIKKVILVVLLVSASIAVLVIGNGYNMYKEAIEQMPLEQKVQRIIHRYKRCHQYTRMQ